ncbi:MAG: archaetidylserine decarboxylase [Planctomycetota bacterium]|nr:archaetidylserine decarboxylase [Planctomycetota bacterium]
MGLRTFFTIPAFPRVAMSRTVGRVSRIRIPRFMRKRLWSRLIDRLGIDYSTVGSDLEDFASFLDLFTRKLPAGERTISNTAHWLSPADGRLAEHAFVCPELSLTLKGTPYSLAEMLPGENSTSYQGYQALQIYLAPYNYHRYHAPTDMEVISAVTEPGDLQPVDPELIRRSMRVIKNNRRILLHCRDSQGRPFALLYVGALNVGGMKFGFDDTLGASPWQQTHRHYDPPINLAKGEDMGCFEMGSTIVIFAPPEMNCRLELEEETVALTDLLFDGK